MPPDPRQRESRGASTPALATKQPDTLTSFNQSNSAVPLCSSTNRRRRDE